MEGPSKAEIAFEDRKDGSCGVSYVVQEPGGHLAGPLLTFQTRLLLAPARDGAPKPNPHLGHCSFSAPFPSTLHPQEYVSPELSPTSELILG